MTLPFIVSVPHAGLVIPEETRDLCLLTAEEVAADGDEGARAVYAIERNVAVFVSTDVARAAVDMNRARDDIRRDGVVKTHTCWNVPIYRTPLSDTVVEALLDRYHRPYHARLSKAAALDLQLGIDCHTMAATGPPVGPDPGAVRPAVCLSNADETCPDDWLELMADCFREAYHPNVRLNDPFKGGFITREHGREMPWMQLELSREPTYPVAEKRARVLAALTLWVSRTARR